MALLTLFGCALSIEQASVDAAIAMRPAREGGRHKADRVASYTGAHQERSVLHGTGHGGLTSSLSLKTE